MLSTPNRDYLRGDGASLVVSLSAMRSILDCSTAITHLGFRALFPYYLDSSVIGSQLRISIVYMYNSHLISDCRSYRIGNILE